MSDNLIHAAGGVGLFLLGMWVMTTGLKELAGAALNRWLTRFTRSPATGAMTGAAATALVQSSSATTLAAIGFVSAGLLTFPQALGILFGANVGTTVTGWLVALLGFKLDIAAFAPLLVLVGGLTRLMGRSRVSAMGIVLAGFGLLFVGIDTMSEGLASLEGRVTPETFPDDTWTGRFWLVLIGMLVTFITQSSSAGVATALAAVHAGALALPQAAAIVIGMDIGTTGTAMISAIGASTQARRTAASHVIYNIITGFCAFLSIPLYVLICNSVFPSAEGSHPEVALVAFHSLFNLAGVLAVLPLAGRFAALIERLIPEPTSGEEACLDRALLSELPVAIEASDQVLRGLAASLFDAMAESLRPSSSEGSRAAAWSRSLADSREFLGDLTSGPGDGELHRRHVALIHVVDHLDRLFQRRASRVRPGDESDRELRVEQALLAEDFEVAADTLRDGGSPSDARALARWRAVRRFGEPYRLHLLLAGARDSIDDRDVLGRIDEVRRIGRSAYHLWRLSHQLNQAEPTKR